MNSLTENTQIIYEAVGNIKTSITEKGVDTPNETPISNLSHSIDEIEVMTYGVDYSINGTAIENNGMGCLTFSKDIAVSIPQSTTSSIISIADNALRGENYINELTVRNSIVLIGKGSFSFMRGLKTLIFEENSQIQSLPNLMCENCLSLKNVTFPSRLTELSAQAFAYCENLEKIFFPASLTTIQAGAFIGCQNLERIYFRGNQIHYIGSNAFASCESLTDVYYAGTQAEWEAVTIVTNNTALINATIHYNYTPE